MSKFNRPKITKEKFEDIQRLIEDNPGMGRSKLSVLLCEMWNWRGANGQTKDMSYRDVLLALEKAGKIVLPKPQSAPREVGNLFLRFKSYIDQYHYLGFDRYIGECMAYMIYSCEGVVLSCLLFGSAAWACKERDAWIGWGKEQRKHNLNMMTNNVRFLVLPCDCPASGKPYPLAHIQADQCRLGTKIWSPGVSA